jgi:hypothetical protein
MEIRGIAYSIFIALGLLIILLDLIGPFALLFFLPVPYILLLVIIEQKFSVQTKIYIPLIISKKSFIRGPPAVCHHR